MNLYTSDLHFGHTNCIRFDNRPFADRDEMDRALIENWNYRVSPSDDVFIVGDFTYHAGKDPTWYLKQLTGHKHLVVGNHDGVILDDPKALAYFESVDKMTYVEDLFNGGKVVAVLCHFPIISWNKKLHGSYHIFGHIHGFGGGNDDEAHVIMAHQERALNAGCMMNGYMPVSFAELVRNNQREKQRILEASE